MASGISDEEHEIKTKWGIINYYYIGKLIPLKLFPELTCSSPRKKI